MENPRIPAVPPVPPVPPVRPVLPVIQFGGNAGIAAADQHLADAILHLQRCLLAIKAAAQADPSLVVMLGTPHAQLQDALPKLEQRP